MHDIEGFEEFADGIRASYWHHARRNRAIIGHVKGYAADKYSDELSGSKEFFVCKLSNISNKGDFLFRDRAQDYGPDTESKIYEHFKGLTKGVNGEENDKVTGSDVWILKFYFYFHISGEKMPGTDETYASRLDKALSELPKLKKSSKTKTSSDKSEKIAGTLASGPKRADEQFGLHWLNPYNQMSIPFVGRDKEIERLNAFVAHEDPFKMWVLTAPSGAGKTRLCHEWIRKSEIRDHWNAFYIGSGEGKRLTFKDGHEARRFVSLKGVKNRNDWDGWTPSKPTLFIIDYMYGFKDVVLSLIQRCHHSRNSDADPIQHNIRLLIIDHVFPENLEDLKRDMSVHLNDSADEGQDTGSKLFFEEAALSIKEPDNQHQVLIDIVKECAGEEALKPQITEAVTFLEKTSGAQFPLFAALIGMAIKQEQDFTKWNRRDLIRFYLRGPDRLPWLHEDVAGKWVSSFVVAATARRGMSRRDLVNCEYGKNITKPDSFKSIYAACQSIISSKDRSRLLPFEPDIMGESFFLEFIGWCINNSPTFHVCARNLLEAGNKEIAEDGAEAFIGFIQRLTRNLLNDKQNLAETKIYWEDLLSFLTPGNFTPASPMRWAVSASLVEIAVQIRDADSPETSITVKTVLNKIDEGDLYENVAASVLETAATYAITCYQLNTCENAKIDSVPPKLLSLLLRLDSIFPKTPSVVRAIDSQNRNLINALIGAEADIDKPTSRGFTPLMLACYHKQEDIALKLAEKCEQPDAVNSKGWTALMIACRYDQEKVALKLIEKCEQLDTVNFGGWTSLMFACMQGQEEVALKLVEKCEQLDAVNSKGWTSLMFACMQGQKKVALKLVEKCDLLDAVNSEGWTSLMFACMQGWETVALKLVDICQQPDAANKDGWTALMFACFHDQENVALELLKEKVNINQANENRQTVLMFAVNSNCKRVVRMLIEKEVRLNETWTHDGQNYTALALARSGGCQEIIEMLVAAGAR